jgi:hypothetical protein
VLVFGDGIGPRSRGGVSTIEPTHSQGLSAFGQPTSSTTRAASVLALLLISTLAFFAFASAALAGNASTGKLAFEPCDKCHPVFLGADGKPNPPLPNGFQKHEIKLEAHDILGEGDKACVVCHDVPTKNPGMLLTADGTRVYVTGEVSRVCQRCHFEKYQQWQMGIHGKGEAKCTAAGCHDPHTPSWIYIAALPPFQGTGMQVKAVGSEREGFKPFASPPVPPPVYTPVWLTVMAAIGLFAAAGIVGFMILGRRTR